jgi:alpha-1,2-mannosyltransferase
MAMKLLAPLGSASDARPAGTWTTVRRVLTVALLALVAAVAHYWYGNRHQFYDLGIYWEAVRWWAGGHDLYSYSRPDPIQGPLGFTYPPFAALLMRPLAALPFGAVAAIFCTLSALALVLTAYWLLAPVADRHGQPRWYLVALALPLISWLEPIRETVSFGQVNLLLVLLVVADLLVAVPRGSRLAGVGIGLAAAIKLTPAIFIGYLLRTRRGRAGLTAVATAVGASLLAAALSWSPSWRFWTGTIWDTQRIGHTERVANQSLLGLIARLTAPTPPNRVLWAALVVVCAGYGLWRARRAALAGDEVTGLTLAALTGALVSPVTWSHHLFWFVPALVVLLDVAFTPAAGTRRYRGALLALAAVVYTTVTVSVIAWYEWGLSRRYEHGVFGFLTDNWYVLLMLALLTMLPIRRQVSPGGM